MNITQVPAHKNNYGVGRAGKSIKYIVLHWIVGRLESCDATFQNANRKASSHYGIGDNDVHQYVQEKDTAWHASNLNMNQESIGIEHEGGWEDPAGSGKRVKPSQQTHETSAQMVADIAKRYKIPLDREHVIRHNEVQGAATACCGTLDVDWIVNRAREINGATPVPTPPSEVDWNRVLTKRLPPEGKEVIKKEFDELVKRKLIVPEDSVQTQEQKWLASDDKQKDEIKELKEDLEAAKQTEQQRIDTALGKTTTEQEESYADFVDNQYQAGYDDGVKEQEEADIKVCGELLGFEPDLEKTLTENILEWQKANVSLLKKLWDTIVSLLLKKG